MHEQLQRELVQILGEKAKKVEVLVRKAIEAGVHVDILVTSEPGEALAWEYFERLGFPKGSNDFVHVHPKLVSNALPGHMRIPYETVCHL